MGVSVRSEGRVVYIVVTAPIRGGDGVAWADDVERVAAATYGPVQVIAELVAGATIPADQLGAACRKALGVEALIESLAFVAPGAAEKMIIRVALAAIVPPYPVGQFESLGAAERWTSQMTTARRDPQRKPCATGE